MSNDPHLPLREPTFLILLSLAHTKKHGYAILKNVESLSNGKVKLSNGTLYGVLSRLQQQGMIERVETFSGEQNGRAKKEYKLTPSGYKLLNAESERLQQLLDAAKLCLDGVEG